MKLPSATVMSIKTFLKSSKNCSCVTLRVRKYLLSIFLHYTQQCDMILSKLNVKWSFISKTQTYLGTSDKAGFFKQDK